jgi:colanic acid biosynthesis glycosyl transferase WcaI
MFGPVPVFHVWMPRKGTSLVLRALSWLLFHIISTLVSLTLPKPDIVIAPSPPLTIGVNAWLIGLVRGSPYVYNVQEIYPDAAIALGVLRNAWLIDLLERLERFVYHHAALVTVIAPQMAARLKEKGIPSAKLRVIPNFVDVDELVPLPKDNAFSREHNLAELFVVSYAGNMGPAQQLDVFIEAAEMLQDQPEIRFLMLGDGILRAKLQSLVVERRLENVTFLPYQPYSLMNQIYASSDLSLVPQAASIADIAVPSKVYRIMACARTVLAVADRHSDLGDLLAASGGGILVPPANAAMLSFVIRRAATEPEQLRAMGEAGRKHVISFYTRQAIASEYQVLIREILGGRQ